MRNKLDGLGYVKTHKLYPHQRVGKLSARLDLSCRTDGFRDTVLFCIRNIYTYGYEKLTKFLMS